MCTLRAGVTEEEKLRRGVADTLVLVRGHQHKGHSDKGHRATGREQKESRSQVTGGGRGGPSPPQGTWGAGGPQAVSTPCPEHVLGPGSLRMHEAGMEGGLCRGPRDSLGGLHAVWGAENKHSGAGRAGPPNIPHSQMGRRKRDSDTSSHCQKPMRSSAQTP